MLRLGGKIGFGVNSLIKRKPLILNRKLSSNKNGKRLATYMNATFEVYPLKTIGCIFGLEIFSLYGTYLVLNSIPSFSSAISINFALAFALSRIIKRFRLPLDLVAASAFVKVFPTLRLINMSKLFNFKNLTSSLQKNSFFHTMATQVKSIIDYYGMGYFVGSRYMGVLVVILIWLGLESGVNVQQFLVDKLGFQEETVNNIGGMLGTWAASVTLASIFYPFTVVGGAVLARRIKVFNK